MNLTSLNIIRSISVPSVLLQWSLSLVLGRSRWMFETESWKGDCGFDRPSSGARSLILSVTIWQQLYNFDSLLICLILESLRNKALWGLWLPMTMLTSPGLCSPGNSNGQKSSSLCVPENRTTQPNMAQVRLRATPLIYLWQGQTQPFQIPILCLISDELNSLFSLMNLDKIPFNLSWLNLVRLPPPLNFDPCSSWANVGMWKALLSQPFLKAGWLQQKIVPRPLSDHPIPLPNSCFHLPLMNSS